MTRPEQNFRDIVVSEPVRVMGADGRSFEVDLDPDKPDYITDDGVEVWIERPAKGTKGGQKTRFVDADGNQVGPIHSNLVPAIVHAAYYGWRDPGVPDWWSDEVTAEVRANTTFRDSEVET